MSTLEAASPSLALDAGDIAALLREAGLPADAGFEELSSKSMGFSGARIVELQLNADGRRLILKTTTRSVAPEARAAEAAANSKAHRTDFSYANEIAFLGAHAAALSDAGGAHRCAIPRPLLARAAAGGAGFILLMDSMGGDEWEQHMLLPEAGGATEAALSWLARFHAAFMPPVAGGAGRAGGAAAGMWEVGTHLELSKRPAAELAALPGTLELFVSCGFGEEDPFFAGLGAAGARRLGERVRDAAPDVARRLREAADTTVHGDFKQANIFFETAASAGAAGRAGCPRVCVIDWQWTGPGCAATDVAYMCGIALPDAAVEDYEARVLRPYHGALLAALAEQHAQAAQAAQASPPPPPPPPYEQLLLQFKLASIDWFRWLGCARLKGFTPESMRKLAGSGDLNRGQYCKSTGRLVWLWQRAAEFMDELYPERSEIADGSD